MSTTRPAKGMRGMILHAGGRPTFRVYNPDHTFQDYDLHHYDLEVEITDDNAVIRTSETHVCIDYPDDSGETVSHHVDDAVAERLHARMRRLDRRHREQ